MKKKIVSVLIATMMMSSMTGCGGNNLTLANDSFDLELGDSPETHTASYVDVKDEKELKKIDFDFSKVDEMTVGDYSATATLGKDTKTFHITVKDTTAPKASAKDEIKTGINVPIYAEDMLDSVTELSGSVKVKFKDHDYTGADPAKSTDADKTASDGTESAAGNTTEGSETAEASSKDTKKQTTSDKKEKSKDTKDTKKTDSKTSDKSKKLEIEHKAVAYDAAGEYDNVLTLTDESGNSTDVKVHIVVTNAPVITGATDIIAEKGSTIDYMNGVTATDGSGNDITSNVTVDSSKVDVNTPGDYEVTYTAKDADGVESTATIKVTISENIEETTNNTDTADGTASEKRVSTSSGTGKASEKKAEISQAHVDEQVAAAEASAEAGNNNTSGNQPSSSSGSSQNQSNNSGSTASNDSSGSNSNTANSGSSTSSSGNSGSSAPAEQPAQSQPAAQPEQPAAQPEQPSQPDPEPEQPSTPSQGPATCDKGSATNGALNGEQKAYIDSLVSQWRSSNGDDGTYSDMIVDYLFQQGVGSSSGGCEHSSYLVDSWEEACSESRYSGGIYNSLYLTTNGEYSNGKLVCYYYHVDIY